MAFTYQDMGCTEFSIIVRRIAEMFSCCSLLILLCNGQNIGEYEA